MKEFDYKFERRALDRLKKLQKSVSDLYEEKESMEFTIFYALQIAQEYVEERLALKRDREESAANKNQGA